MDKKKVLKTKNTPNQRNSETNNREEVKVNPQTDINRQMININDLMKISLDTGIVPIPDPTPTKCKELAARIKKLELFREPLTIKSRLRELLTHLCDTLLLITEKTSEKHITKFYEPLQDLTKLRVGILEARSIKNNISSIIEFILRRDTSKCFYVKDKKELEEEFTLIFSNQLDDETEEAFKKMEKIKDFQKIIKYFLEEDKQRAAEIVNQPSTGPTSVTTEQNNGENNNNYVMSNAEIMEKFKKLEDERKIDREEKRILNDKVDDLQVWYEMHETAISSIRYDGSVLKTLLVSSGKKLDLTIDYLTRNYAFAAANQ
jgi:hypothetical protein